MERAPVVCAVLALGALCACAEPAVRAPAFGIRMASMCLSRAMHPGQPVLRGTPNDQNLPVYFRNYFEAFLDAKEQRKYLDCLKGERDSPDSAERYARAKAWLKLSQQAVSRNMKHFPKDKRIVDVDESYVRSPDGRTSTRRVVVTQRDGTRTVFADEVAAGP